MLHPVVRKDRKDVERLAALLNQHLLPDGYELVPKDHVSGRPIFGWNRIPPVHSSGEGAKERHFTEDVGPLVATLSTLAQLDGSDLEQEAQRPLTPSPDLGTVVATINRAHPTSGGRPR